MRRCEVSSRRQGFTLIEVMVVVAIIAMMTLLVFTVLSNARKEGRDIVRINDAKSLALSIRLLKEELDYYPGDTGDPGGSLSSGVEIGNGGSLDDDLVSIGQKIKADPLDRSNPKSTAYGYYYYSNLTCNGVSSDVVIVQQLENTGKSNFASKCGGTPPSPINSNSFVVFVH